MLRVRVNSLVFMYLLKVLFDVDLQYDAVRLLNCCWYCIPSQNVASLHVNLESFLIYSLVKIEGIDMMVVGALQCVPDLEP